VIVFVVVVASSLAVSFAVRAVVADQQHRLLQERAGEAADLVSTAFGSLGSTLPTLAATYPPGPGATAQFTSAARSDLGLVSTIGALTQESGSFRVLASVGTGPGVGVTVAADRAELARRALATKSVVDASIQTAKGPRLSFALNAGHGQVLYEDLAFDPTMPLNLGPHGPFNELDGALYASHTPTPSSLVITTTKQLPLAGQVVRTTVSVGSQTWVLVARSRGPLVGSLAANAPWVALAGGLAAALLLSVLVETLGRRRAYALELVEEKTSELRAALEVQAGLEQGQRQAREAAEAANRAKSEFLSRMSHELRTPLNAILGFGQLLELDELGPTQQDSVDQILKGGRHLLDLINEILDISRIETGALALSPEPVSVPEAVADVLTLMQPLAAERRIGLIAAQSQPGGPDADSYVLADRQRLKQVLLNLVANAIKYNRDGGQVRLTWEPDGDGLNIKVTDT
jgi:signal transduction histidine kinase